MEQYSSFSITAISLLLLVVWQWENVLAETSYCSCYSFQQIKKTWAKSVQYCQQNGWNLVSMETEEEYHFINKTIQSLNVLNNEWYIGLKRIYSGNKEYWRWTNGQIMTIHKWRPPHEPSGDGPCVKMIKDYKGLGLFNDVKCTNTYMSICEYKTVQKCPSNTTKWCPSTDNKLVTTTKDSITTTFSPTRKETTPTPASSSSTTTTQRQDSLSTTTDEKSTVIFSSSTENWQQQTKTFIQTTKPEAATARNSSTAENERATGPTQKIGDGNGPRSRSSGASPFPLVIVTVALGAVLAVSVCLLVFVCYWKRRNRGDKNEKPKSETASIPRDATEQPSNNNQGSEGGDTTEGVQLFHQHGGDPYVAYAVIHNNLTQQNQGPAVSNEPAYASIEDEKMIKRFSQKNCANAATPVSTINTENSGNSAGVGKSNTEAVYASVDKSKKNNIKRESQDGKQWPAGQQVVYASVDKSKKSKAQAEDVVYAEVGSKDNTEKQQPYQITYAELGAFNQNTPEQAVKPAPYQPAEYAVIIGQKPTS